MVGDTDQAGVHVANWWQMLDIALKSQGKINEIWNGVGERLAAFLEGKK